MIADPALRWLTTALFVFAGGYCAYRLSRPGDTVPRIGHGLHVVMCGAMIAMAWPQTVDVPAVPQAVFFAAATVWFLAVAGTGGHPVCDGHEHGRLSCGYHALMMAAMVWMVAVMAGWLPGGAAHTHGSGDAAGMAGMDMPGMDMGHGHGGHAGGPATPAWITVITLALTVVFAAAAVVWLYRFFAHQQQHLPVSASRRPATGAAPEPIPPAPGLAVGLACEVAMAAGMAIMLAVMV
ncbi:DUF5134 domain-containing protein [Rhodococcus wratislaviensis]|uniref:DUF5134 domain-containing protein n=1 Tax=Rhodococcus wratislaviensis TaxID=44752 RepID=UPI003650DE2D